MIPKNECPITMRSDQHEATHDVAVVNPIGQYLYYKKSMYVKSSRQYLL